jgi:hypothetical protein
METGDHFKNGASLKSQMSRIVFCFVVAGMAFSMTGCGEGDTLDPENPNTPSAPKTFVYTASAGSGGSISPSGQVSISQGGDKVFTASPNTGRIVDEWKVNGSVVASSGNSYTVQNVQSSATIQVTFKEQGYAPDALQSGYIFESVEIDYNFSVPAGYIVYRVLDATRGYYHLSYNISPTNKITTPYTYRKTGPNTATFNFSCQQYINGPVSSRTFYYNGTLTYTSASACEYTYDYTDALGVVSRNRKAKFKVYVAP